MQASMAALLQGVSSPSTSNSSFTCRAAQQAQHGQRACWVEQAWWALSAATHTQPAHCQARNALRCLNCAKTPLLLCCTVAPYTHSAACPAQLHSSPLCHAPPLTSATLSSMPSEYGSITNCSPAADRLTPPSHPAGISTKYLHRGGQIGAGSNKCQKLQES
jgi:hypothetical protein